MNRLIAPATCPTCQRTAIAERDEDGTPEMETWPCQGSDDCTARVCAVCAKPCDSCGLIACEKHIVDVSGEWLCAICLDKRAHEIDMAPQETIETLAVLSAAQCTPAEARAALAVRGQLAS